MGALRGASKAYKLLWGPSVRKALTRSLPHHAAVGGNGRDGTPHLSCVYIRATPPVHLQNCFGRFPRVPSLALHAHARPYYVRTPVSSCVAHPCHPDPPGHPPNPPLSCALCSGTPLPDCHSQRGPSMCLPAFSIALAWLEEYDYDTRRGKHLYCRPTQPRTDMQLGFFRPHWRSTDLGWLMMGDDSS